MIYLQNITFMHTCVYLFSVGRCQRTAVGVFSHYADSGHQTQVSRFEGKDLCIGAVLPDVCAFFFSTFVLFYKKQTHLFYFTQQSQFSLSHPSSCSLHLPPIYSSESARGFEKGPKSSLLYLG